MTPREVVLPMAALLLAGCVPPASLPPEPPVVTSQFLSIGNEEGSSCSLSVREFQRHGAQPKDAFRKLALNVGMKDQRPGFEVIFTRGDVFNFYDLPLDEGLPITPFAIRFGPFRQAMHGPVPSAQTPASPSALRYVSFDPPVLAQFLRALETQDVEVYFAKAGTSEPDSWAMPPFHSESEWNRLAAFRKCVTRFYVPPTPRRRARSRRDHKDGSAQQCGGCRGKTAVITPYRHLGGRDGRP